MRALLYKDFVSSKKSYLLSFIVILFIGIYGAKEGYYIVIPLLCVYLPVIFNNVSFAIDEQVDFYKFAFTSPISRKTFVESKYILSIIFGILAFISSFIICKYETFSRELTLGLSLIAFMLPLVFTGFQVPFFLKYGAEKGKILVVATYFILFAFTNYLGGLMGDGDLVVKLQAKISSNFYVFLILVLIIALVLIVGSIKISTKIVKNKEF